MPEQRAVEYLMIYDPQFSKAANAFSEKSGSNSVIDPVIDLKSLFEAPKKYAMVRHLEILLHGTPGMLYLADKSACKASYFGSLLQAANTLSRDARVLFFGCNLAGGADGNATLDDIGKKMFIGGGGTLGASTTLNFAFDEPIMNPLAFIDGRFKTRRYDENGDRIGSEDVDLFGKVWHSTVR